MSTVTVQTHDPTRSRWWLVWMGRVISVLPVFIILMSSRWKLTSAPFYVQEWTRIGWKVPDLPFIASLQLGAILLYVIPRTTVLGAVILTGYLGGAIATYVELGSCIRRLSHSQRQCSPGWESTCATSVSERCFRSAGGRGSNQLHAYICHLWSSSFFNGRLSVDCCAMRIALSPIVRLRSSLRSFAATKCQIVLRFPLSV